MTTILRSEKYGQTIEKLKTDPIVLEMFEEIKAAGVAAKDVPMTAALDEYHKRGGRDAGHIGAIQETLIELERSQK